MNKDFDPAVQQWLQPCFVRPAIDSYSYNTTVNMDEHVELVKAHLKRYEAILAQREALCKKHNAVPNALRAAQARRAAVVENIEATTETQTVSSRLLDPCRWYPSR